MEDPTGAPGLGDCHIHMILDGIYWKAAIRRHMEEVDEGWIRRVLAGYRDQGVTYLRDGGDTHGVCLRAAQLAPEYGIEYRMPVFAMHHRGRYGSIVGFPFDDRSGYRKLLKDVLSQGADFIKIMVAGILDFHEVGKMSCEPLPAEEIRALVEEAHEAGMAVMLHINGAKTILAAIEAGADSLEHGFYMDEECAAALGEHRDTVWIPSMAPVGNQIGSGRFPDEVLEQITRAQQAMVRRVVQAGGRVALGSDAGAYLVPHGKGALDEYRYLAEALQEEMPEAAVRQMLKENEEWIRRRFHREQR